MRARQDVRRVPDRLMTFSPDDWPDGFEGWIEARREWQAVHGWPGGAAGWAAAEIDAAAQTPDEPWRPEWRR